MKKKLFLCFRPLPIETETRQPDAAVATPRSDDGVSCYTSVTKVRNAKTSVIKSPAPDIGNRGTKSRHLVQKSDSCRAFSRVLKSILFEASLKERVRDKTVEELMLRSKSDGSRKMGKFSQKSNSFDADKKLTRTSSMIPSSLSSNRISKLQNCRSLPDKKQSIYSRSNSVTGRDCSSSESGLYLILITLCITILCGRVYAILLMSIWVYFIPSRREFGRRRWESRAETKAAMEYEKRMVIMEGLIERNHHSHREGIKVLRDREFSRV